MVNRGAIQIQTNSIRPPTFFNFNYSTPFEYSDSPPDINALVQVKFLTVGASHYDAPLYQGGAMFTDDYELYTYG